ncbi:MAG: hypothetical protein ABR517_12735 [Thermoanaerobaculia bacterium]
MVYCAPRYHRVFITGSECLYAGGEGEEGGSQSDGSFQKEPKEAFSGSKSDQTVQKTDREEWEVLFCGEKGSEKGHCPEGESLPPLEEERIWKAPRRQDPTGEGEGSETRGEGGQTLPGQEGAGEEESPRP